MKSYFPNTVKTEIIENLSRTLELPLLVRSVSQVRAKGESSPKPEIPDVLASFSITSVLTVGAPPHLGRHTNSGRLNRIPKLPCTGGPLLEIPRYINDVTSEILILYSPSHEW